MSGPDGGEDKSDGRADDGSIAACFEPRHGIRAETEAGSVDFVICFQCLSMKIYHNGEASSALTASTPGDDLTRIWATAGLTIQTQN
jgi:hypothetical protein